MNQRCYLPRCDQRLLLDSPRAAARDGGHCYVRPATFCEVAPNLHGLIHVVICELVGGDRLVVLSRLHQHLYLRLEPLDLTLRHLHELIVLEQLLWHVNTEHSRQVTHVVLFYLSVGLLVLGLRFVALGDHLVLMLLLSLHEAHFQSLRPLLRLAYTIVTLVFELLSPSVLLFHLSNH